MSEAPMGAAAYPPGPWRWEGYVLRDANGRAILFAEEIGPRCSREMLQQALAEGDAMQALIASAPQLAADLARERARSERLLGALQDLMDALEEGRAWSGDKRYIAARAALEGAKS